MKQILILLSVILISFPLISEAQTLQPQSETVSIFLNREKSPEIAHELAAMLDSLDNIYSNLHEKVAQGKKLRIFIDPAHGKVINNGTMEWEGALTWRKSTTGLPEELYSIPISRKIYKRFTENGHFEVVSTSDFMEVLEGKSESYNNITFDETVKFAKEKNAFMIIAEHLNNISPVNKADGLVNLRGLHLTCTEQRKPLLSYVDSVYRGYYTFYSIYDMTGTSKLVGEGFREKMLSLGHDPNGWENGNVADDRFSIYINYPISTIYESGFISNPVEEKLLRDETYQDTIVESQYEGILSSIKKNFGVDLSQPDPVKTAEEDNEMLDILKVSRIIVFYTQKGEFAKAISAIDVMENKFRNSAFKNNIWSFSKFKSRLSRLDFLSQSGQGFFKKGQYGKASSSFLNAIQTMAYHPLFNNIREATYTSYNNAARKIGKREIRYNYDLAHFEVFPPDLVSYRTQIEHHSFITPYLLTIGDGQTLDDAIDSSIAPSDGMRIKVSTAIKRSYMSKATYVKQYSKKANRYVYRKQMVKVKSDFTPGLYVIYFDKNLVIKNVTRVPSVVFDSRKYQNQLYFKNSCLAERSKEKAL
jgi:N-acetylmuramoyl-L-alanine amidase